MKTIIPTFLSKLFNKSSTKEDKDKLIRKLRDYKSNVLTKELIQYLELEIERETKELDSFFPVSLFQSKYKSAHSRGKRQAYLNIIKQLRSDDV